MEIDIKQLLTALCAIPTVSGFEKRAGGALDALAKPYFDESLHTPVGNHIYIKRCGKPNAKKFLLDAHFDEIGFLVREIAPLDEGGEPDSRGFLGFVTVGGVDTRLLPSAEVTVWGERALPGVITSTPPHLQKSGEGDKLPELDKLWIDTGLTVGELTALAPVGTPVTFAPRLTELQNGRFAGKAFDDKACVAAVIAAAALLEPGTFDCDVYALFSAMEETGGVGGITGAFGIEPDCAVALDVDFARGPDTPKHKSVALGGGPSLSISMASDRALSQRLIDYAKSKELKLQTIVEAKYTGTNGDFIHLTRGGVPTAVVSIPLRYMHACAEVVDISDVRATAELIAGFVREGGAI